MLQSYKQKRPYKNTFAKKKTQKKNKKNLAITGKNKFQHHS